MITWIIFHGSRAKKNKQSLLYIINIYNLVRCSPAKPRQWSLAVKERNKPAGELLKSWAHGYLIQICLVGHRIGDPLIS